MFDDLSLGGLFAMADKIGDKYLTDDEMAERNAKYDAVLALMTDDGLLD